MCAQWASTFRGGATGTLPAGEALAPAMAEPEPEPEAGAEAGAEAEWMRSERIGRTAGSKTCNLCGLAGHLRYACPQRLEALSRAAQICASEQRLAWSKLSALLPHIVAEVATRVPATASWKVTSRAFPAQPWEAGSSGSSARCSRKVKGRERRQRKQAAAREWRREVFSGLEKADRSAWFNAKEKSDREQRDLVVAAACGKDNVRVVIDLGYGAMMSSPKEHRSTAQQCMLCWAALRRAQSPCALSLTSVAPGSAMAEALHGIGAGSWVVNVTEQSVFERPHCAFPPGDRAGEGPLHICYLSPDAPDILEGVSADCVFVIGGLVDRTVIGSSSLNRVASEDPGVMVRRLPLREYLGKSVQPILNISTVFEVLQGLADGSSMRDSLRKCVPKRKQQCH